MPISLLYISRSRILRRHNTGCQSQNKASCYRDSGDILSHVLRTELDFHALLWLSCLLTLPFLFQASVPPWKKINRQFFLRPATPSREGEGIAIHLEYIKNLSKSLTISQALWSVLIRLNSSITLCFDFFVDATCEFWIFFSIEFSHSKNCTPLFSVQAKEWDYTSIHYEKGHNMILKNCMLFPHQVLKA